MAGSRQWGGNDRKLIYGIKWFFEEWKVVGGWNKMEVNGGRSIVCIAEILGNVWFSGRYLSEIS